MFDSSMKVTRFKLAPNKNFEELRLSPGVDAFVGQVADGVAAAAGPGFEARRSGGSRRARRIITPTTPAAFQANKDYALLRALQSYRW